MTTSEIEFTGLAALRGRKKSRQEAQENRDRPKATWFKINQDEQLTVRFLQELDKESPNYNPAFGTYLGLVERQAPGKNGHLSRCSDTTKTDPEGRCFAEEMLKKTGDLAWKRRENFYINVAVVRPGQSKPSVEILSRNLYSDFVDDLGDYNDDNGNTITDRAYTIKRVGFKTDTKWKLKESKEEVDIEGLVPWDLDIHAKRDIPYEKQEEFFRRNWTPSASDFDDDSSSTKNSNIDDDPSW